MTDTEERLWSKLRKRQVGGFKFRRQYQSGHFILDFVCLEARLVIEVDGGQHAEQCDQDQQRTAWLEEQGFRVLRFWNNEVLQETESVMQVIWDDLSCSNQPPSQPSP